MNDSFSLLDYQWHDYEFWACYKLSVLPVRIFIQLCEKQTTFYGYHIILLVHIHNINTLV